MPARAIRTRDVRDRDDFLQRNRWPGEIRRCFGIDVDAVAADIGERDVVDRHVTAHELLDHVVVVVDVVGVGDRDRA